jgi:hypothetical protein
MSWSSSRHEVCDSVLILTHISVCGGGGGREEEEEDEV